MDIIPILDFICSGILVLAVYLCGTKPKIGWLIYWVNSILYIFLMVHKELNFLAIAGIILLLIGIKNWRNV